MAGIHRGIGAIGVIAVSLAACTHDPTAVGTPDLDVRMGKPVTPAPPSNITVMMIGRLPSTTTRSGAPIGFALTNGPTRAATRVVGSTRYANVPEYPFTWTAAEGISALAIPVQWYGWPFGVSDNGIIVGEVSPGTGNRAFSGAVGTSMSYLPVLPNTQHSGASSITADGICISGYNSTTDSVAHAVVWRNGALEEIGLGMAKGVSNDCLRVAGSSGGRAVVWQHVEGEWTVETLPFPHDTARSEATDISPNGEYVSGRRTQGKFSYAVVWRRTSGGWTAIDMPGKNVYAFGVDNSGRAVGNNAAGEPVVWTRQLDGTYTAQVLPPLDRSTQGWAASINELGQVAGRSKNRDGWQAVVWTIL